MEDPHGLYSIMDPEACPLRKEQLPEQEAETGQANHWMSLYLVSLLAAALGLIICLYLLRFVFANDSSDIPTTMDILAPLNVPKASELDVTRPSRDARSHGTTALPDTRHHAPSYPRPDSACGGCRCRSLGQWIRDQLDHSVDPCKDFYAYVCNNFRGSDEFTHTQESIRLFTQLRLIVPLIPESNQLSWQKAAGMYHACLNFASSYEPETQYLIEWMRSLNLDLMNETILAKVNPIEIMVRGSLDLGVHVVFSIEFREKDFLNKKRLCYSAEQRYWYETRQRRALEDYMKVMITYGAKPPVDKQLASKIKAYNDHSEWHTFFAKYTNGTYTGSDQILYEPHIITVLVKLFKNESMGEKGLQYLVAWSVYRQLVQFTDPYMFLRERTTSDACYEHVREVMNLAVISPFFMSEPYPDAPLDLLFPTWIKALSLHSHYIWSDQTTPLYDEANRNSYYSYIYNDFTIPTADLLRPFAYSHGPLALTYGGLGMIAAHEFMHAFDVIGMRTFEGYQPEEKEAFLNEYTKRALCLRRSHRSVLSLTREQNLSAFLDNENLADLVGTKIAYQAFASLIPEERTETLAGLDMSPEQLFFFNNCLKWCAESSTLLTNQYAPFRSRCMFTSRIQDLRGRLLYNRQLLDDENESGHGDIWINLFLASLLIAIIALVFCIFVFTLTASNQSQDCRSTADTVPAFRVPKTPELRVTPPVEEPRLHTTNASATTSPDGRHNVPSSRPVENECSTCSCRSLGQWIRDKLDYSIDPCKDFYKFVCNTFRGQNEFVHIQDSVRIFTLLRLIVPYIPESNQLSWQKAAGMYHACLSFTSSYEPETRYLVEWMKSLNLDFLNETTLAKVNPVGGDGARLY
ncbi:hypothetical protein MTO96_029123 [Rhipicephalus appendiculatus]